MLSKLILILLGVVLLLKGNDARYHDMDSAMLALGERMKLLKYTRTEFSDMGEEIIGKGVTVMEKVLKDPKLLSDESDLMKSNLNEIRGFVEKYKEYKKEPENELVNSKSFQNRYHRIVYKYNEERNHETPEEKAITNSFKENGIKEVNEYVKERAAIYAEKFYDQIRKYFEGLTETQKQDESELVDLMKAYEAVTNPMNRGEIVFEFINNVEIENFLW